MCSKSLQLCPTLCDPMDYSLLGSSVHGILQARILEWFTMPSSRGSSWTRDWTCISCIGRYVLYHLYHMGSPQSYKLSMNIFFSMNILYVASLVTQTVKDYLQCGRPGFDPWVGKVLWKRAWQPVPVFLPGESPWTEEPDGLQSMGSQRVGLSTAYVK